MHRAARNPSPVRPEEVPPEVEVHAAEVAAELEEERQKRELESDPILPKNRSLQGLRHVQ